MSESSFRLTLLGTLECMLYLTVFLPGAKGLELSDSCISQSQLKGTLGAGGGAGEDINSPGLKDPWWVVGVGVGREDAPKEGCGA